MQLPIKFLTSSFVRNLVIPWLIKKYDLVWNIPTDEVITDMYLQSNLKINDLDNQEFEIINRCMYKRTILTQMLSDQEYLKLLNKEL